MNYYPHHIGDYAKDAGHLTLLEDGAYRRMLDTYYSTEKPLPLDRAALYRLLRVQGAKERQAVDSILTEFFREGGDGWHHKRCDEEIERAHEKSAKAAASAGKRWHSEGNANASADAMRTHSEGNAPNNQEPITNNQRTTLSGDARLILAFLNEKTGRHYEPVPANLEFIVARMKDGATVEDLRAVVAKKCREWAGDEKMAPYLRPATLFNRTKFAQYQGELHREVS